MIEVKNLSKDYKDKNKNIVHALNNVSFTLPNHGLIFIVGKSGSGKSTLLNVLGALDNFDSGDIIIEGKSLKSYSSNEIDLYRKKYLGFVFQEYNLLDGYSVEQNIMFGLTSNSVDDSLYIENVIHKVQLDGMNKRSVNSLSGVQKQRVTIARALVKNPKLLLCDEPTGSLDSETGNRIFELLKEISKESLVLIVSHDNESAKKYADRIISIKDGKIENDFSNTELKVDKQLNFYNNERAKIPAKTKVNLSLNYLKRRPFRLMLAMLISILCFILFGVADTISSNNTNRTIVNSLYKNNVAYLSYCKGFYEKNGDSLSINNPNGTGQPNLNMSDIEFIEKELDVSRIDVIYDYYNDSRLSNLATEISSDYEDYYYTNCNGFIEINDNFIERYNFELFGKLPKNDSEVVITKYMFDIYKKFGYAKDGMSYIINDYNDIINKTIFIYDDNSKLDMKKLKIVGVLDTKFNESRYKLILENETKNVNVLKYELREIMEYGLHNIYYLNKGFYDRNIKEIKNNYFGNYGIFNITGQTNSSIYGVTLFDSITTSINNEVIFFKNKEQTKLKGNDILLPLSTIVNSEVLKYETKEVILDFCKKNIDDVKAELKEYLGIDGAIDYNTYYEYIASLESNQDNVFHNGKTYEYFQKIIIDNYINAAFIDFDKLILDYMVYSTSAIKYDVNLAGFYIDDDDSISQLIVSGELMTNFCSQMSYMLNDYRYCVIPVSNNFKQDLDYISFSNKQFDENIKLIGYSKDFNYAFSKYNIKNEITYSLMNIDGILDMLIEIFKYISLALFIFTIIFVFYYFSGVIYDKKREIGILRAMGYSKKDIVDIFIYQNSILCFVISIISISISAIVIDIGNKYLMNNYYLLISILNFSLRQAFIMISIAIVTIFLGILIPLVSLMQKKPHQLITKNL